MYSWSEQTEIEEFEAVSQVRLPQDDLRERNSGDKMLKGKL